MTKKKLAIIDGDSLCYLCSKEELEESQELITDLVTNILLETGSEYYYLFLSEGKYFRHQVNKQYKSNRPPTTLLWIKELKQLLKDKFLAESWKGVEADDAVAYKAKELRDEYDILICAMDKDVKGQVPGNHYNYRKLEYSTTTEAEAELFLHVQSCAGDAGDAIKGLPGVGPVKALKILKGAKNGLEMQVLALKAYQDYYKNPTQALHEYQKNYKQVRLMSTKDEFLDNVDYLPPNKQPIKIN